MLARAAYRDVSDGHQEKVWPGTHP
jgi:hypothetical protein